MLPGPVALESFQAVTWVRLQIVDNRGRIEIAEFSPDQPDQISRETFAKDTIESVLGPAVAKASDHERYVS